MDPLAPLDTDMTDSESVGNAEATVDDVTLFFEIGHETLVTIARSYPHFVSTHGYMFTQTHLWFARCPTSLTHPVSRPPGPGPRDVYIMKQIGTNGTYLENGDFVVGDDDTFEMRVMQQNISGGTAADIMRTLRDAGYHECLDEETLAEETKAFHEDLYYEDDGILLSAVYTDRADTLAAWVRSNTHLDVQPVVGMALDAPDECSGFTARDDVWILEFQTHDLMPARTEVIVTLRDVEDGRAAVEIAYPTVSACIRGTHAWYIDYDAWHRRYGGIFELE